VDAMPRGGTQTPTLRRRTTGGRRWPKCSSIGVQPPGGRGLSYISSDGYDAYIQPMSEQVKAVTPYPLW
jgi:hypothetical protein